MKKSKIIIIYAILLLVLFGCGGQEKGQQQEIKSKDKAPDSLKDLSSGMDDILKSLSDIERLSLNIPLSEDEDKKQEKPGQEQPSGGGEQGGGQQGDNQEKQSSDGGGQEGQEGQGGQGQGGQQGQGQGGQQGQQGQEQQKQDPNEKKNEEIKSKWEEIQKKLDEIHPHWNSFEAEGQKKGATKEAGDKFEASFNKMTKAIEKKNIIEIYDYASQSL